MPISDYIADLRASVGTRLLLMPGVAAVIRNERGEVLAHERRDGLRWSLPAGAVDPGETPAQAMKREVREETGLEVTVDRLIGVMGGAAMRVRYPNGDRTEYTTVVFACTVVGGHLHSADGEATGFDWFAPSDLPQSIKDHYPAEMFVEGAVGIFQR